MFINVDDNSQFIAGIMLHNQAFVEKLVASEKWLASKNPNKIESTLLVCGVELDSQIVEDFFKEMCETWENRIREKYDANNIDRMVEEKARELLKEQADGVLEKMYELSRTLEDSSSIIKPYWAEQ